jgi:hypothetical protein
MAPDPYYAEAFSLMPGRWFRMVALHGEAGPMHCAKPVAWRGFWRRQVAAGIALRLARAHRPQTIESSDTTT